LSDEVAGGRLASRRLIKATAVTLTQSGSYCITTVITYIYVHNLRATVAPCPGPPFRKALITCSEIRTRLHRVAKKLDFGGIRISPSGLGCGPAHARVVSGCLRVGLVPLESCRSVMPQIRLVTVSHSQVVDLAMARHSLSVAWTSYRQSTIQHFREGLEFGRVCHEWRAQYKAQGSRKGKGFDHLLEAMSIPRTTAYRWIRRYEIRNGLCARRNEVREDHQNHAGDRSDKPIVFRFSLGSERQKQFEDDVTILGGREKVTEMLLDFVARSAFEKRKAEGETAGLIHSATDFGRQSLSVVTSTIAATGAATSGWSGSPVGGPVRAPRAVRGIELHDQVG
jgi:hypothetical protein